MGIQVATDPTEMKEMRALREIVEIRAIPVKLVNLDYLAIRVLWVMLVNLQLSFLLVIEVMWEILVPMVCPSRGNRENVEERVNLDKRVQSDWLGPPHLLL
tara:strand:- start:151 stop:453 length:303 start_codon:yes stop_codon:yes gene_type:complete